MANKIDYTQIETAELTSLRDKAWKAFIDTQSEYGYENLSNVPDQDILAKKIGELEFLEQAFKDIGIELGRRKDQDFRDQLGPEVEQYKVYLQKQLANADSLQPEEREKLSGQLSAMEELEQAIQSKVPHIKEVATKVVNECIAKKVGSRQETSFLQKFAQILEMGYKKIYQAITSKKTEVTVKDEETEQPKGPN